LGFGILFATLNIWEEGFERRGEFKVGRRIMILRILHNNIDNKDNTQKKEFV
jgi:hypothetical protein